MKQTTTPSTTPSPKPGAPSSQQVTVGKPENPTSVFITMALDMSWRLAIAVLVPVIGGFELDTHLGMTPLLTIVGFLLAMAGAGLVMWRTMLAANQATANQPRTAVRPGQEKRT